MDRFSKRNGYVAELPLQYEAMNNILRNRLWNLIYEFLKSHIRYVSASSYFNELGKEVIKALWDNLFNNQLNQLAREVNSQLEQLQKKFFPDGNNLEWFIFYDGIEIIFDVSKTYISTFYRRERRNDSDAIAQLELLKEKLTKTLKDENAGYRLIDNIIVPITNELEIQQIESALTSNETDVNGHLEKALTFLSDKRNPDYENSIKESVSAIEALFRKRMSSDKQLSDLIKKERADKILKINPMLLDIISKLYAYRGDVGGVGHSKKAIQEETNVDSKEALLFIVICSGLINYLRQ